MPNASPQSPPSAFTVWALPVACALITVAGVIYTAYSNYKTQSAVEIVKTNSEQRVAKLKADTEVQIATLKTATEKELETAKLRSQEDIIRLNDRVAADKEGRSLRLTDELAARNAQTIRCNELKAIRDDMSVKLSYIGYQDPRTDVALADLRAAYNKITSYMTIAGMEAVQQSLKHKKSTDQQQRSRDFFASVLEGYNAEIRLGCAR